VLKISQSYLTPPNTHTPAQTVMPPSCVPGGAIIMPALSRHYDPRVGCPFQRSKGPGCPPWGDPKIRPIRDFWIRCLTKAVKRHTLWGKYLAYELMAMAFAARPEKLTVAMLSSPMFSRPNTARMSGFPLEPAKKVRSRHPLKPGLVCS